MKRFKNILLIFDEGVRGKAACTRAATLAMENQAQLNVVEVIGELPADAGRFLSVWRPLLVEDPRKTLVRERQEQLAQCIESLRQQGIKGDTNVLVGVPFLEITREVLRNGHDLVIMTAEGKCGVKEWLFGATSMRLMRKCPCPVWVVKPAQHEPYARILAAVDTDPDDDSKDALNSIIMDLATSLAQLERSVLYVVHVWALFGEQLLRDRGRVPANELAGWLRKAQDRHQRALDRILEKYDLAKLEHRIHLHKGEPESAIPELARVEQVDLIVMGTVCRTGIAGFIIGNTAERILQQVDCSVLTVKPDGFVSPVTVSARRQPHVDGESEVRT